MEQHNKSDCRVVQCHKGRIAFKGTILLFAQIEDLNVQVSFGVIEYLAVDVLR